MASKQDGQEDPPVTDRRQRPSRLLPILIFVLLLAGALYLVRDYEPPGGDQSAINIERAWRRAQVKLGRALPGTPDLSDLAGRLREANLSLGAPLYIRIFKREFEMELWIKRGQRFHLFTTYPICRWSGRLGPKLKQGDKQAPEGFYTVSAGQLNPNSRWHRSFNIGFPNLHDRAFGRTGTYLMVHGGCSSAGCYAMTNPVVDEIWRLVTASLGQGQQRFPVHIFPFRMSEANMGRYAGHRWSAFWRDLKRGFDAFEATHVPPAIKLCGRRYVTVEAAPGSRADRRLSRGCPVAAAAGG